MGDEGEGRITDVESADSSVEESLAAFERALRCTIATVEENGGRLWIMKSVPLQVYNVPRALLNAQSEGLAPENLGITVAEHREQQAQVNLVIDRVALETGLRVLDPTPYLALENGRTRVELNGMPLYLDKNHIDPFIGAPLLRPMFMTAFVGEE
jgi:hypothetical protein